MVKNLVSKSAFAEMAGVSPAAVTKAAKTRLAPALEGKRIDANHPEAISYVKDQQVAQTPEPLPGIDPLYEEALAFLLEQEKPSITKLQRHFKIGFNRAKRVFDQLQAANALEKQVEVKQIPSRSPSGRESAKQSKKTVALAVAAQRELQRKNHEVETPDNTDDDIPEDLRVFMGWTLEQLIRRFGSDVAFGDWLKATQTIEGIHEKRLKNAQTEKSLVSRQLVKNGIIDPINATMLRMMTDGSKTIATRVAAMTKSGAEPHEIEEFIMSTIGSYVKPLKSKMDRSLKNA